MDEIDKTSTKYFMTQMTQEEFNEMIKFRIKTNVFETGWSKDDRYILNKICSDHLNKLDNGNQ